MTFPEGAVFEVARLAGRELRRRGSGEESLIQCPHADRHARGDAHPSCRLNGAKNTWYCDVCGVGGGVTDLARGLGVELAALTPSRSKDPCRRPTRVGKAPLPLVFQPSGPVGPKTMQVFADDLAKAYATATWTALQALEGLVHPDGLEGKAESAVAFPLPGGGFHVYRYRRADKKRRWCFANGGRPGLLTAGLDRPDPILVCEGEWDAMRAHEAGFAVATGTGAGIVDPSWGAPIAGREVAIVYDVDPAGVDGALKVRDAIQPHAAATWIITLPLSGNPEGDGKDLSDFVAQAGPEALHALVRSSTPEPLKAIRGCVSEGARLSAPKLLAAMASSFPGMEGALHAGLALHGYLCFEGSNRPCALFYLGPPSSGKSLVDRLFLPTPECPEINDYVYRCDDFTPASFVSRAASISAKRLAEIDLLPKLANKVLNTKELAPIFRGKADDLTRTFAVLTSVLDGDGFVAAGGSVGTRGYSEPIFFCWLGATTPLTTQTWKVMAALGPRILFYETAAIEPSLDQLVAAQDEASTHEEYAMRLRVNGFLKSLFERYPPRSLPEGAITCSPDLRRRIALYARFLARLRAGLSLREPEDGGPSETRYEPPSKEHEFRLVKTLNRLAKASALVMGRDHVDEGDLGLVRHLVVSSAPETRRKVAVALLNFTAEALAGGSRHLVEIPVGTIARTIHASLPTTRHYAEELDVLQIATYRKGTFGDSDGGMLSLAADLRELVDEHTHPLIAFKPSGLGAPS